MIKKLKKLFYLAFAAGFAAPQRAKALPAEGIAAEEQTAQKARGRLAKRLAAVFMAIAALLTLAPGTALAGSATPGSYDFGNTVVGSTSSQSIGTVLSSPICALDTFTGFNGSNGPFSWSGASAGVSTITLDFIPASPGIYQYAIYLQGSGYSGSDDLSIPVRGVAYAIPNITGVSPGGVLPAGGGQLTITGSGFADFAGAAPTQVLIGGVPATNVSVANSTQITCNAPPGAEGTADITVTSDPGGLNLSSTYSGYSYAVPTPDTAVSGLPHNLTMSVGGAQSFSPLPPGGTWHVDGNMVQLTQSGNKATIKALREGDTNLTYTLGWTSHTISLHIDKKAAADADVNKLKTGDEQNPVLWILLAAASGTVLLTASLKMRKWRRNC